MLEAQQNTTNGHITPFDADERSQLDKSVLRFDTTGDLLGQSQQEQRQSNLGFESPKSGKRLDQLLTPLANADENSQLALLSTARKHQQIMQREEGMKGYKNQFIESLRCFDGPLDPQIFLTTLKRELVGSPSPGVYRHSPYAERVKHEIEVNLFPARRDKSNQNFKDVLADLSSFLRHQQVNRTKV